MLYKIILLASTTITMCGPAVGEIPRNIYGAHLLVESADERGMANLRWARHLVGRYGYAKTLMSGITKDTRGAKPGWIDWVNQCYKLEMIPVCRLAGVCTSAGWTKPQADPDCRYSSMAEAVKRVVSDLPKSDTLPIYIEVWNEPNLDLEWSGKANLAEYARFFVDVSKAIRSLNDKQVLILNGAFAPTPLATEQCCEADPEFARSFDVWASHPYPYNNPPEVNLHDGTAKPGEYVIDFYLQELAVLARYGRSDVKVMLTETGYALGCNTYPGYPTTDDINRADNTVRAFRDYWEKWPEVVAVLPFELSSSQWMPYNWVDPSSGTNPDGSPTQPHYCYTMVSKLAKSTDLTGAISGKVTDGSGKPVEKAAVRVERLGISAETDALGSYIIPMVKPGYYLVEVDAPGRASKAVSVRRGKNSVADLRTPRG